MLRLWNSMVERVVRGALRGWSWERPERRVPRVEGERVFGLGSWAEGGIEMIRDAAEQRWKKVARRNMVASSILGYELTDGSI